ncbi:hypothetical protein [Magnetococcus marinus]|nr:hypothetical protein [Magnetococcus marinus]
MERDKTFVSEEQPFRRLYWTAVPVLQTQTSAAVRSNRAWGSLRAAAGRAAREMDDLGCLLEELGGSTASAEETQQAQHAVHFMRRIMAETVAFEARLEHMAPASSSLFPAYGDDEVLPH